MNTQQNDISSRVRAWRRRANLSYERAGGRIGVSGSTVMRWERGTRPVGLQREAIERILGESERVNDNQ